MATVKAAQLLNELNSQAMIVAVVTKPHLEPVIGGFEELFERGSGVVFVSDCGVRRCRRDPRTR